MKVKEHDFINFSIRGKIGVCRYYNKEVFEKNGSLIVRIDDIDVQVEEVFHIEIVGNVKPEE